MGAAVTGAEALVVIDCDAAIVEFAAINRALLAASHGREDYITLRLTAPAEAWSEGAAEVGQADAKTLPDKNSFAFWKDKVREKDGAFAQTNYMFDEQLYKHVHQLAKNGRIWARTVDLRDEKALRGFAKTCARRGGRLAVVDTSNVQDVAEAGPTAETSAG